MAKLCNNVNFGRNGEKKLLLYIHLDDLPYLFRVCELLLALAGVLWTKEWTLTLVYLNTKLSLPPADSTWCCWESDLSLVRQLSWLA